MAIAKIDGLMLKEMFISGANNLLNNSEMVDSLNVFPVPDGDTGTNMSHTIESAVKELSEKSPTSAGDVASCVAKGALRGARGNSGVILSQILRGLSKVLAGHDEMDGQLFAEAMTKASSTAYKAVMKPKEGTILTVQRVISEDIAKKVTETADLLELFEYVLTSGEAILAKTPDMLPVLKQAGVVDSGGKGLLVIYYGMLAALKGEPVEVRGEGEEAPAEEQTAVVNEPVEEHVTIDDITNAYDTEFIVTNIRPEMKDSEISRLRRRLERIGDSVRVIADMSEGDKLIKVHVHTNEPGKALQMALELGELDNIKIDNRLQEFRAQHPEQQEEPAPVEEAPAVEEPSPEPVEMQQYGVVSVSLGQGFSDIFKDLGVTEIVEGGQTMNPSIQDILNAIEATNARNVFVLPNNGNVILAAQQAAELSEKRICVIPTKSVPMGISAMLSFSPEAEFEDNEAAMRTAADGVHTASVTYAVRNTVYDDKEIKQGDIMGLIDNKVEIVGSDIPEVAQQLVDKMVTEDSGLITIYRGADMSEDDAKALTGAITAKCTDCDVELQFGGQPLYYYLIGIE